MRLVPYTEAAIESLPAAPGWPHDDTAAALSFSASGAWTWLILDDEGRIAGECGVKTLPDATGIVEIGYGLAGPSRGHGLGTRAVRALVDELRARPDVHTIVAEVAVDNLPSRRLLEALGFSLSDLAREYVWYRCDVSAPPRGVRLP